MRIPIVNSLEEFQALQGVQRDLYLNSLSEAQKEKLRYFIKWYDFEEEKKYRIWYKSRQPPRADRIGWIENPNLIHPLLN